MRKIFTVIALLLATTLSATSQTVPLGPRFILPYQTVIDNTGVPLPGALLYFYASGTNTPLATYSDPLLTVPNPNPVQANAAGLFPNIFMAGNYKIVLTDSSNNQIWTADPVDGSIGGGGGGGVTIVSIVSANGLAGTVANPTTAPAITLSTTVTGLLQGNGTSISAATAIPNGITGTTQVSTDNTTLLATDQFVQSAIAGAGNVPVGGTTGQVLVKLSNTNFDTGWETGGGGVSTVSVVGANGFAGTVANPTTTPAITLSTSITGVLQGNGTAISAAGSTATFGGNAITFPSTPANVVYLVGSVVSGHCTQFSGTLGGVSDAGAICGSGGGGGGSTANRQDFVSPGDFTPGFTQSLTLSSAPVSPYALTIAFNGVVQSGNTWSLSGRFITFNAAIPPDVIVVDATWLSASVSLGTVTSVGLDDASNTPIYGITNSPVTNAGNLTLTLNTQSPNVVFAGPSSGGANQPSFRSLVGADLPLPAASTLGGIKSITSVSSNWVSYIGTDGTPHQSQPTYTDLAAGAPTATASVLGLMKPDTSTSGTLSISGGVVSCTTMTSSQVGCAKVDGTTITISGGAISAVGSSLTVGSPISGSCTSGYVVYSNGGNVGCEVLAGGGNVSATGTPTLNQLAIWTNSTTIEGVTALPAANFPTLTGDVTTGGASLSTTVAKIDGFAMSIGGTITTAGNVTVSGAHALTLTISADTSVILPTGGTLVNSGVATLSSLTSIGTIGTGTWQGTIVGSTYGGTGINNGSNTLTLGGALTTTGAATPTLAFGSGSYTYTFAASANDSVALLGKISQAFSGGVHLTSYNIGTVSSGTTTIDCGNGPSQYLTNGGAFTLAAPANDSQCLVLVINNGSAGAITPSGFTAEASHGDAFDTTSGHKFTVSIWRVDGTADYRTVAMQ